MKTKFLFLMTGLIAPLSLSARPVDLSEIEVDQLLHNKGQAYVYCDKQHSKIAEVMARVSKLDNDAHSPIRDFDEHIKQGFKIGRKEAVVEAIEHAQVLVNQQID